MSKHPVPEHPTHCENCDAALQGEFCHACGQSIHNPIRHLGHAVEEFFEAFWHLDGRVFRTLRDLMVPGRVATGYLAGHRARYIAPLRMFVVLSVLTFFIGAAAIHVEDGEAAAANRIVELEGPDAATAEEGLAADSDATTRAPRRLQLNVLGHSGEWHPKDNPFIVGWWPGFANDWLNRKLGNLEKNMQTLENSSAEGWLQSFMAAAPTALFLLVPVFAILLKFAYLFTRRVYLEHLVVALYSHAFLLIMLTVAFLLSAIAGWVASAALGVVLSILFAVVLAWMPIYLLLMQKRVYGQAWWLTVLKYLVIGNIYFMMLLAATIVVFLSRLTAA